MDTSGDRLRFGPRCFYFVFVLAVLWGGGGCRSQQLRHDQDRMREAVLDLYTNQIMDNLIRAYIGLPMVQIDYTALTGTVTQEGSASAGQEQTLTTERDKLGVTTLRRFLNDFKFSIMGDEKLQLTITGNPVLNNNEVYNAYLEFISKPERFMVTPEPPGLGEAHIVRCSKLGCEGNRYYWVPREYSTDFLRLALVTTVQRGQPLSTPEYYENVVMNVEDDAEAEGYILIYLKKSIPNDGGVLSFTLSEEPFRLAFSRYPRKIDKEEVPPGKKINRILLKLAVKDGKVIRMETEKGEEIVSKLTPADFKQRLVGQTVRIDLNYFKPTIPTTEDLLQAIRHEVGLIRLEEASR